MDEDENQNSNQYISKKIEELDMKINRHLKNVKKDKELAQLDRQQKND